MRKRSHGVGKRLTSVLLLGASLILVTVGYAGFGVIESGSNNSADLVFVSVDDEGASNITLGKLGIAITGTTSQLTFNTLYEYEYSYDYFSDSSHDNEAYDISTESSEPTSSTTTSTVVNGKIKIGLTVNLDSSYDSGATDDVPNIANLDYDDEHYKNLKLVFGYNNSDVANVTTTIYPTNISSRYCTLTGTYSSTSNNIAYTFPLKSQSSTSLYDLATYDSSYPKYTSGVISDYNVPITIEFDFTATANISIYNPNTNSTFTATFSIEGTA